MEAEGLSASGVAARMLPRQRLQPPAAAGLSGEACAPACPPARPGADGPAGGGGADRETWGLIPEAAAVNLIRTHVMLVGVLSAVLAALLLLNLVITRAVARR
jgi:hypothetical protein